MKKLFRKKKKFTITNDFFIAFNDINFGKISSKGGKDRKRKMKRTRKRVRERQRIWTFPYYSS